MSSPFGNPYVGRPGVGQPLQLEAGPSAYAAIQQPPVTPNAIFVDKQTGVPLADQSQGPQLLYAQQQQPHPAAAPGAEPIGYIDPYGYQPNQPVQGYPQSPMQPQFPQTQSPVTAARQGFHFEKTKTGQTVEMADGYHAVRNHGIAYKCGSWFARHVIPVGLASGLAVYGTLVATDFVRNTIRSYTGVQVGTPEQSEANAKRLTINPKFEKCYASTAYDVTGTQAVSEFLIANKIRVPAYGAVYKPQVDPNNPKATLAGGIVLKEYCVKGADIKQGAPIVRDGKEYINVVIPIDSVIAKAYFDPNRTRLVEVDPVTTKVWGGAGDILSGTAQTACVVRSKFPKIEFDSKECEKFAVISNWKANGQAALQQGTEIATIDHVIKCGEDGWKAVDRKAIADGVMQEVIADGFDPRNTLISFVDKQGDVTDASPDFGKTDWEEKYGADAGQFGRTLPGTPTIKFKMPECSSAVSSYTPDFPKAVNEG